MIALQKAGETFLCWSPSERIVGKLAFRVQDNLEVE